MLLPVAFLAVLLLAAVSAFYTVFGKVVPPTAIGLRQNYFAVPLLLDKGFEEKGLAPGIHWQLPYLSAVHLLPRNFQFVQYNSEAGSTGLRRERLEIPTSNGSKVLSDLTLIVRLFDKPEKLPETPVSIAAPQDSKAVPEQAVQNLSHGGPKQLVESLSLSLQDQLATIARLAEGPLKASLGSLSTDEYYNPALRETAAIRANYALNVLLNPRGAEVWATLIRRYLYAEKKIDDQIFNKNLQDQTQLLNASLSELAKAKATTEETRATWDAKIATLKTEGEAKVRVLESEASLYENSKYAEGNKLTVFATAEVETAKNEIFATPGTNVYVGRQMLPILSTLSGGIITGLDPYDLNAWIERLTGIGKMPELRSGQKGGAGAHTQPAAGAPSEEVQ